jgi:hypothetical protein
MIKWGIEILEDIMYTDESRFALEYDGPVTYLGTKGDSTNPKCCIEINKYPKLNPMFWGGIFIGGRTSLIEI